MTDEEILAIAHRTATVYRHRSGPESPSYGFVNHTILDFARKIEQAATAATQERCAKACDAIAEDKWVLYKGRPPYTGKEPGRASDYVQGQSDGADQCADAIRKGCST